jgi:AraC family transcriptional regulator
MYQAILKFDHNEQAKYKLSHDTTFFERVDTELYDGTYCQLEWFTPVTEKYL